MSCISPPPSHQGIAGQRDLCHNSYSDLEFEAESEESGIKQIKNDHLLVLPFFYKSPGCREIDCQSSA
jgi:hypothetical protein